MSSSFWPRPTRRRFPPRCSRAASASTSSVCRSRRLWARLRKLCNGEDIEADDHALRLIARYANGALRDAESLLDQLGSSSSMRITANDVREALGATDSATVKSLIEGLIAKDPSAGFEAIQMAMDQGADARQVAKQMVDYLRALMQVKASANPGANADQTLSEAEKVELAQHAEHMSMAQISKATRSFSNAINEMRTNTDAQLALEMAYLDCIVVEDIGPCGRAVAPADVPAPRLRAGPANTATTSISTSISAPASPLASISTNGASQANGTSKPTETATGTAAETASQRPHKACRQHRDRAQQLEECHRRSQRHEQGRCSPAAQLPPARHGRPRGATQSRPRPHQTTPRRRQEQSRTVVAVLKKTC